MFEQSLDNRPCGGKYGDIVQSIGHTPLVELKRLAPKPGVRLYAKLESANPTGSVKDRVGRALIEDAESGRRSRPGQTILEPTSGNTGISLAMICSRKGYPLKVVMPDNVTEERTQLLRMYGADLVYSPAKQGSERRRRDGARHGGERLLVLHALPSTGTRRTPTPTTTARRSRSWRSWTGWTCSWRVSATGGTLMGNGRRLKEENPDTLIVAAEPLQGELVQGLRPLDDGFIPPIIDLSLLGRKIFVSNRDSVIWTKKLLAEEGIFAASPAARSSRSRSAPPSS